MSIRQCSIAVLLSVFLAPHMVHGTVVISEVAWMGTGESANAEWIELYNAGDAVSLDGWTLNAVDGQPAIELAGTLTGGAYALLERTSDDTLPGVSAFLIYTGALGNDGEVLELRNASGALVDRVLGADGWAIGGDNATKETLQRLGNPPVGDFVTGAPTPASGHATVEGSAPVASGSSPSATAAAGGGRTVRYGTSGTSDALPHLEPGLVLEVPETLEAVAGVPREFTVRAYKESGKEIALSDVAWVFGDGTTGKGQSAYHTYRYPGTYLAVVRATRSGFLDDLSATARIRVQVHEPALAISEVTSAYVALTNESLHEVDLSACVFALGASHAKLPTGTTVLPGATVRFPLGHALSAYEGAPVTLYRPGGVVLAQYEQPSVLTEEDVASSSEPMIVEMIEEPDAPVATPAPVEERDDVALSMPVESGLVTAALAASVPSADADGSSSMLWWLVALAAAIIVAIASIHLAQARDSDPVLDFEIEGDE